MFDSEKFPLNSRFHHVDASIVGFQRLRRVALVAACLSSLAPMSLVGSMAAVAQTTLDEAAVAAGSEPVMSPPAMVVITEIMTNPSAVVDSRGEWFELHNPGASAVDLSGWTVTDENRDRHVISGLVIEPGGYAVLARSADRSANGGVGVDYRYGDDIVLLNAPDRLVLLDAAGREIDRVDYGQVGFPRPKGRSMSLRDPFLDNATGGSWCYSTTAMSGGDLGSPGRSNTCSESEVPIVISEIMQNPKGSSDRHGEWFEFANLGSVAVDLSGFVVKDDDTDRFVIEDSLIIPAGGALVLGRSADSGVNGHVAVSYAYGDAMALHNSQDELVILDLHGIQIDRVAWDDGRTFPDPDGASMMLADLGVDNARGSSWCSAPRWWPRGDRGTPGASNDCSDPGPTPAVTITEVMYDPEAVGDRVGEWFELANLGASSIDLSGWVVRDDDLDSHVIGSLEIPAGGRVVLAESGDVAENGGLSTDYVYGADLIMHNNWDEIVLEMPDGTRVDRVAWDAGRSFPVVSGASMVLASALVDSGLGANWCPATDRYGDGDLGSPGEASGCLEPGPVVPLLITEVMRNPFGVHDDQGEWLEVFNPTDEPVDLRSWALRDDGSDRHVIRSSVVVPARGYAVLGRNAELESNGGVSIAHSYGVDIRLGNGADEIVLTDSHGRVVDRVAWDDGAKWIRPNGASMARISPESGAGEPSSWCESDAFLASGDRATPGSPTQCLVLPGAGRVVISEIHRDPAAVPDSLGEWVEFHNPGSEPIDLLGWTLRDDDWDDFRIDEHVVIPAGGYVVIGKVSDPRRNGGAVEAHSYGTRMFLYNAADEIALIDPEGIVVDRVVWNGSNGFPLVPGASMSLRDPGLDNAVSSAWCASVTPFGLGDRGTPGAPNVCDQVKLPSCGMSLHPLSKQRPGLEVKVAGLPRFDGEVPVLVQVEGPDGFTFRSYEPLPDRSLFVEIPGPGTYRATASATDGSKSCFSEASVEVRK
jgi:hypothetical protein